MVSYSNIIIKGVRLMLKRKVSLEDFYDWYQENKIRLREDASKYSIYNEKLHEEFLKEWPLDRILTMSIIYNISTNFIFGNISQDICRKNFVLEDTIPAAKEGRIQELVDQYLG